VAGLTSVFPVNSRECWGAKRMVAKLVTIAGGGSGSGRMVPWPCSSRASFQLDHGEVAPSSHVGRVSTVGLLRQAGSCGTAQHEGITPVVLLEMACGPSILIASCHTGLSVTPVGVSDRAAFEYVPYGEADGASDGEALSLKGGVSVLLPHEPSIDPGCDLISELGVLTVCSQLGGAGFGDIKRRAYMSTLRCLGPLHESIVHSTRVLLAPGGWSCRVSSPRTFSSCVTLEIRFMAGPDSVISRGGRT
jgi:hypothetical protein